MCSGYRQDIYNYCIDQVMFHSVFCSEGAAHISPGCNPGDKVPGGLLALKGRLMTRSFRALGHRGFPPSQGCTPG